MLRLDQSQKYQKDLQRFQYAVSQIQASEHKQRAEQLLKEYKHLCNLINESHNPNSNAKIDPRSARDLVEDLYAVRKQLEKFAKDLDC